jgi:hypothetical protein
LRLPLDSDAEIDGGSAILADVRMLDNRQRGRHSGGAFFLENIWKTIGHTIPDNHAAPKIRKALFGPF